MKRTILENETMTREYAKDLAGGLSGGEILALVGDLGAGKTTFAKGVALGLGINEKITSPTFVYMKVYEVNHPTIKKFCHIDAYRLENEQKLIDIGALEYFSNPEVLTVIEWADKIKKILPKSSKLFNFSIK